MTGADLGGGGGVCSEQQRQQMEEGSAGACRFEYPTVRRDDSVVDVLHGVKVADPYRWLEDVDSPETAEFVAAQNRLTQPFIEACPARNRIRQRLTRMMDYEKMGCPARHGDRYFYHHNSGLQNQYVFYVMDSLHGEPRVFLDPNKLSEDGTVALKMAAFSEDGQTYAYGLSTSGSDWSCIHFRSVETGKDYPEVLEKVKFSGIAWTHDNAGVFYGRFNQQGTTDGSETTSNVNQKLYYHRLGTPQTDDVLCVEFAEHPRWRISAEVSECGGYLVLVLSEGCKDNLVCYVDLHAATTHTNGRIVGALTPVWIVDKFEADYDYVTNTGTRFLFHTNRGAPNYRLMIYDLATCEWSELLAEQERDVLDWAVAVCQDKLVVCYMHDVCHVLQLRQLETGAKIADFDVPLGTVAGLTGRRRYSTVFYRVTSFLSPGVIYHCDLADVKSDAECKLQASVFRETTVEGFDAAQFECRQVFYPSKDGTRIPMFIMHRRDLKRDGSAPCLLYAYGGFNISMTPSFSVTKLLFIERLHGVLALPNIRGGGEYGERWHNAGRLLNKQNCFDDFAAAAQHVIAEHYTSAERLVCEGGSNGGLLVGATVNQHPALFGAAVAHVGVMDMLRYHRFTIGYAWTTDYGSPDQRCHFENLYTFSPLHNIGLPPVSSSSPHVQYPAMLLLTADHDDRVVPLHSLKHIAQLQHAVGSDQRQKRPLLVRVDTKAGHGAGKPTNKVIDEFTDVYCFIVQALSLPYYD